MIECAYEKMRLNICLRVGSTVKSAVILFDKVTRLTAHALFRSVIIESGGDQTHARPTDRTPTMLTFLLVGICSVQRVGTDTARM